MKIPAPTRPLVLSAAVLVVMAALASASSTTWPTVFGHSTQAVQRWDGEYGLWVEQTTDSLAVHWITTAASPGFLRATARGRVVAEQRTPAARAHTVALPRPRASLLVLEYGDAAAADDRHRTSLYLDDVDRRAPSVFSGVDSLFVVGDVHGEFERLVTLLRNAGVIDEQLRWTGGRKHVVLVGDMTDRGPDVMRTLWFLHRLEREAAAARGRVHIVLGNHEIMVMLDDLRYVSRKEMTVAELHGVPYWRLFDSQRSILGRWLATKPALLRIDRVLLAHGGVSPDYLGYTVESYADTLAANIQHDIFRYWNDSTHWTDAGNRVDSLTYARWDDFFWGENSVFWFRGYVQSDTLGPALKTVLERMRADVHVVGHTTVPSIEARYDGALIPVNTEEYAVEMLLLVRTRNGYERYRYGLTGPPERF